MDVETLGTVATAVVVIVAGAYNGWRSHRAERKAEQAAKNSHPVSNGWGAQVSQDLQYLRSSLDRAHMRMDEQARRHNTTDQRLTEATSYARSAAEQSSAVSAGLTAHLADHAAAADKEADV